MPTQDETGGADAVHYLWVGISPHKRKRKKTGTTYLSPTKKLAVSLAHLIPLLGTLATPNFEKNHNETI